MNALTLEIILQVVFGVTDEARLAELRPLVNRTVNIPPLVFLGWGFPRLQKLGPWRRTVENQVELDRVIFGVIAERRSAPDLAERSDVLSRLLQVRDEDGAGPDRRGAPRPAGHPPARRARDHRDRAGLVAARARQGPRAGGEGAGTPRRPATTTTSRRCSRSRCALHPVIPMVVRHLMAPATIGGIDLPQGANVAASIILAHESEASHPDHTGFRPERFLDGRGGHQHLDPVRWRRTPLHRRRASR